MYLKMHLLLHLFMAKKMQTLKLDPELIKDLKKLSKKKKVAFNKECEEALTFHVQYEGLWQNINKHGIPRQE